MKVAIRLSLAAAALLAVALPAPARAASACTPPAQLGVAFVLDDSGSMATSDPRALRGTATGIGLLQMPDHSVASVSTFDDVARWVFGPIELTGSRATLSQQVMGALAPGGQTDYQAAFLEAGAELAAMPASVDRKAVVFLSDGMPTSAYTADRAIAAQNVPIFTIGFGSAPDGELQAIATRSGGASFAVASPADAQAAFARIVSRLDCDEAVAGSAVAVAPGHTQVLPFSIVPGDVEYRALAAWSGGAATVQIRRPDGSLLTGGSAGAGETFATQPTFASIHVAGPAPGGYALQVTASPANAGPVDVTLDVWRRHVGVPPAAPALVGPADAARVTAGPVTFTWAAAAGATGYQLFVDGHMAGTAGAATSATVSLPAGDHRWLVAALNQDGNAMSATRLVRVAATAGAKRPTRPARPRAVRARRHGRTVTVSFVPTGASTTVRVVDRRGHRLASGTLKGGAGHRQTLHLRVGRHARPAYALLHSRSAAGRLSATVKARVR